LPAPITNKTKKWLASVATTLVVVVGLAAVSAWLWSGDRSFDDLSLETTPQKVSRLPAQSALEDELFISAKGTAGQNLAREATSKTGVRAVRARKVKFNSEPLRDAKRPGDRLVRFQLFSDTVFVVRFLEASPQLNRRAEFVGQVEGDPDSRVQIWATKTALTGELATAGRTFRFVPTTGGYHYIIEVDPSR
jgi:hypothetical protein